MLKSWNVRWCLGENSLRDAAKSTRSIENDSRRRKGKDPVSNLTDSLDSGLWASVEKQKCLDGRDGARNKVTGGRKQANSITASMKSTNSAQ
jgi:hypothetical protein